MPLSFNAKFRLDDLKARGISPTLTETIALNDLGLAVDNAGSGAFLRERGLPVIVGGAKLWPMTCLGASVWDDWAEWFGASAMLSTIALAFILAHGRDKRVAIKSNFRIAQSVLKVKAPPVTPEKEPAVTLDQITDRATALRAILSWFSDLTCTIAELDAATGLLLGHQEASSRATAKQAAFVLLDRYQDDPARCEALSGILDDLTEKEKQGAKAVESLSWRQHCNELGVLTGTDPDYWMRSSRAETVRCYALAVEHDAAKAGGETGMLTPTERAIKALQKEYAEIIERHTPPPDATEKN
jgi:hypothetical protein